MKRTVFIVGAGASSDFGMPVGSDLVSKIRTKLTAEINANSGPIIDTAMRQGVAGDFGAAARDIAGGMLAARSIDRYLETRKDRELVTALGKLSIASVIAAGEYDSDLAKDGAAWSTVQASMALCQDTWVARLFALLQEGVEPAHSADVLKDVSIVTFNYDRLIERYLELAFVQIMNQPLAEAQNLTKNVPIVHVYGSLGPLNAGAESVPFGDADGQTSHMLGRMALGIRTFTEQHDSATLARAHAMIDAAEVVVFLGFAFDQLNVDALFPKPLDPLQKFIGTTRAVGPAESAFFEQRVRGAGAEGWLVEMDCADLVTTYDVRAMIGK